MSHIFSLFILVVLVFSFLFVGCSSNNEPTEKSLLKYLNFEVSESPLDFRDAEIFSQQIDLGEFRVKASVEAILKEDGLARVDESSYSEVNNLVGKIFDQNTAHFLEQEKDELQKIHRDLIAECKNALNVNWEEVDFYQVTHKKGSKVLIQIEAVAKKFGDSWSYKIMDDFEFSDDNLARAKFVSTGDLSADEVLIIGSSNYNKFVRINDEFSNKYDQLYKRYFKLAEQRKIEFLAAIYKRFSVGSCFSFKQTNDNLDLIEGYMQVIALDRGVNYVEFKKFSFLDPELEEVIKASLSFNDKNMVLLTLNRNETYERRIGAFGTETTTKPSFSVELDDHFTGDAQSLGDRNFLSYLPEDKASTFQKKHSLLLH